MGRPFKCRRIHDNPEFNYFKPAGIPGKNIETVILTLDEYEAVRLVDFEGSYQEKAAEKMEISRQTLGNILRSAHFKIADCITHGKAILIEGGVCSMNGKRTFECSECNKKWKVEFGTGRPNNCPKCDSKNIHRTPEDWEYMRSEHGYRKRHNRRMTQ